MADLKVTLQEQLEYQREGEWRRAGVPEADIVSSRTSGMDPRDIGVLRDFSRQGWLFVVRCPKAAARGWHGIFKAKVAAVDAKTGTSGVVVSPKAIMVSDYDLMSVWRQAGLGWQKVAVSAANGAKRGPWPAEAQKLVHALNQQLVTRLQHGCQDDYASRDNRGVKPADNFSAFIRGSALELQSPTQCRAFYREEKLTWPYDSLGNYQMPKTLTA